MSTNVLTAEPITLLNGATATLRPVSPDDADRLRDFFGRVSRRSLYLRFHHHVMRLTEDEIRRFTEIDCPARFGIVATVPDGEGERVIGMGHYYTVAPGRAEVAFLVDDEHQGLGIATHILDALMNVAKEHHIRSFGAFVLAENDLMMEVFRATGLPLKTNLKYGTFFIEFPLQETINTAHPATPEASE
jgi:RimJ/RimL family protein N-acetyltransferase